MAQGVYAPVESRVDVGALVRATTTSLGMSLKEFAITTGMDESTLTKALRGAAPLDLWKLCRLPLTWWQTFLPKLASALIQAWFSEVTVDVRMAKADLRDERKKERA